LSQNYFYLLHVSQNWARTIFTCYRCKKSEPEPFYLLQVSAIVSRTLQSARDINEKNLHITHISAFIIIRFLPHRQLMQQMNVQCLFAFRDVYT
jgi:hypothetical protein